MSTDRDDHICINKGIFFILLVVLVVGFGVMVSRSNQSTSTKAAIVKTGAGTTPGVIDSFRDRDNAYCRNLIGTSNAYCSKDQGFNPKCEGSDNSTGAKCGVFSQRVCCVPAASATTTYVAPTAPPTTVAPTTAPASTDVEVAACNPELIPTTMPNKVTIKKATYDLKASECRTIGGMPPSLDTTTTVCKAGVPCATLSDKGQLGTGYYSLSCQYRTVDKSVCSGAWRPTPATCKTNKEENLLRSDIGYPGRWGENSTGCVIDQGKSKDGGCYNYFVDNSFCDCKTAKFNAANACYYESNSSYTPTDTEKKNCNVYKTRATGLCAGVNMNAIPGP